LCSALCSRLRPSTPTRRSSDLTPKFGSQIDIRRDDFMLKTDKDGERTTPFVASQIAGKGALVVTEKSVSGSTGGPQFGSPYDYPDRKSTRLNSSHGSIAYAVFC